MCGIIGVFNNELASKQVLEGLSVMHNRGRDAVGVAAREKTITAKGHKRLKAPKSSDMLGHCLHSLVGFIPQPLEGKGKFVINGEIYNWRELNEKYNLKARNDSEVVFRMLEKKGKARVIEVLNELDGVYAFAYWIQDEVILARDLLGIKPIWYSFQDGFSFASERKALDKELLELNPRQILIYNLRTKKVKTIARPFITLEREHKEPYSEMQRKVLALFINAVAKRIPDEPVGILFSGGIDSTLIALTCQKLGVPFTCYTAALKEEGMQEAPDMIYAKRVAKEFGFPLKVKTLTLEEVHDCLKTVVPRIEDSNVVKVGVALTFHVACQLAQKDGMKVVFSGLGSEELFAGYERHKQSQSVNKECLSGLLKLYERDLYRDDVITMNLNLELRLPYLDKALLAYAINIPEIYKLIPPRNKIILRDVAKSIGVPEEYAERKKTAAQYGSRFDRAIEKLAKRAGFLSKSAYLDRFYEPKNVRLVALISSGKDSVLALHTMMRQNYPVVCLATLKSTNPDSFMFHTPNVDLVKLQAESMGIPLIIQNTVGKKEEELEDLKKVLEEAKKKYGAEGVVTGALFSQYQRDRIERVADALGLKIFAPLWHMDQELEMRRVLQQKYEIMLSSIAAQGLDVSWLGRPLTDEDVNTLVGFNRKFGFNIAGEGGEFESLVLDAPCFKKKIVVEKAHIEKENEYTARYVIEKAALVKK